MIDKWLNKNQRQKISLQHHISFHLPQYRLVKTKPVHVSFCYAFWKYPLHCRSSPPPPSTAVRGTLPILIFFVYFHVINQWLLEAELRIEGYCLFCHNRIFANLQPMIPTRIAYLQILPTNDSHRPNCRQKDSLDQPLSRHHKLIWLDSLVLRAVHHL